MQMSDPIKDGGPVFPTLYKVGDVAKTEGGLTIRDWFAVHAPHPTEKQIAAQPSNGRTRYEIIADLNYEYADAMIARRQIGGAA
jgi:hypothetical protein